MTSAHATAALRPVLARERGRRADGLTAGGASGGSRAGPGREARGWPGAGGRRPSVERPGPSVVTRTWPTDELLPLTRPPRGAVGTGSLCTCRVT